jgi:hypothetical protein
MSEVMDKGSDRTFKYGEKPRLSDSERQDRVQAKARELMLQHEGMAEYMLPGSPAWGQEQIDIRDRCFAAAQAEVDVAYYSYKGVKGPDDEIDWSQPAREGLRAAQGEVDLAQQAVEEAQTVYQRAQSQLDNTKADLTRYNNLDERIRQYTVDQLKAGQDTELNYSLKQDKAQQSRLQDRHDIASSATERLASELRTAEQRLSHKLRVCHIWATKVLLEEYAEERAAELRAAMAKVDSLRNDLLGLSYAPFPSQQGPTPLNHELITLLRSPQPAEPSMQELQPYKERWLAAHRALMDDPDAELDD